MPVRRKCARPKGCHVFRQGSGCKVTSHIAPGSSVHTAVVISCPSVGLSAYLHPHPQQSGLRNALGCSLFGVCGRTAPAFLQMLSM